MPKDIETVAPNQFFQSAQATLGGQQVEDEPEIIIEDEQQKPVVTPVKKVTGDDSVKALKQQRDNAIKERDALDKKIKELKGLEDLAPLKPVKEYIAKKFGKDGKLDEDAVNTFITKGKERKAKVSELDTYTKEKDAKLKDIEITLSDEYIENYSKPWTQAEDVLLATLAPIDAEGAPKNLGLINELKQELLRLNPDNTPRTALQNKAILAKFSKIYEQKTQEPYLIPDISKVNDGIGSVFKCAIAANKAKKDWEVTKKQSQIERDFRNSEVRKEQEKKELEGRNFLANKAINSFDYKSVSDVFTEDELKETAKEQHEKFTKMMKGEEPAYTYDKMVELSVKASKFDDAIIKVKELQKQLAAEKKKRGSSLPGGSADRISTRQIEESNDDDEVEKADPKSFFQQTATKIAR